jgi:hypothetical protein
MKCWNQGALEDWNLKSESCLGHEFYLGFLSCDQMKENNMAAHVEFMDRMRNACYILAGKRAGKRALGRPRRRWNIFKNDLREVGYASELDSAGSG